MVVKYVIIRDEIGYRLEAAHLIDDERKGYLEMDKAEKALNVLINMTPEVRQFYSGIKLDHFEGASEKNRQENNQRTKREYRLRGK